MTSPDSTHPQNTRLLDDLRGRYYFAAAEEIFSRLVESRGALHAGDYLSEAMRSMLPRVNALLQERKNRGEIRDENQARKSLAGNVFQALVARALIEMQAGGLIPAHLIFALKPKSHPKIRASATIHVGGESLRPDLDLLAFSELSRHETICVYSLKTSLRERAGQSHRWKLLYDIATAPNSDSIKRKYGLRYDGAGDLKMGLITTNFYDEISNPQHRAAFEFLDGVYIAKPDSFHSPVRNFSRIAADLRQTYGDG